MMDEATRSTRVMAMIDAHAKRLQTEWLSTDGALCFVLSVEPDDELFSRSPRVWTNPVVLSRETA